MEKIKVLGVPIANLTIEKTVQLIAKQISKKERRLFHIVTANPEIIMASQKDADLKRILDQADLLTADGIGIVLASKIQGFSLPERVTGYDLFLHLLDAGNQHGWSFYILGSDEETNLKATEELRKRYPNITISGRHHGFFKEQEEGHILAEIQATKPTFLIAGLGAPFAEKWIYKHKSKLAAQIAIGVGGSLDVISGKVKRAPVVWQKLNVEWLYRLIKQPSRWRRQLVLPRFAWKCVVAEINKGTTSRQ
jgi:N-acetylglucosaminyldiphosphoundecaprenol N-acetyl-beta-D-mannosaminyltransferase